MFKKADKKELRTWMLGSVLMFIIAALVSVIQIGSLIKNGFSVGALILSIIFLLLAVLFGMFIYKSIIAYKTYDERASKKEAEEKAELERREAELKLKHEQEKNEMEEIRKREAEKQRQNMEELEAKRKEEEEQGE